MSAPTDAETPRPWIDHAVDLDDVPAEGALAFALSPSRKDEAALAEALGILGVSKVAFSGDIRTAAGGGVTVSGHLGATVTQTCVVTLEPVRTRIEEAVERRFLPGLEAPKDGYQLREDEDVDVDALGATIDLGALASEALALALPSYPRSDGAALEQTDFAEPGVTALTDEAARPFAALAALKQRLADEP